MTDQAPTPLQARRNIARQQRFWTRRAVSWDHGAGNNPGLVKVVSQVVGQAKAQPHEHVVDLGCGSGQVALALAPATASVLAIDVSQKMIDLLLDNARQAGVSNVEGRAVPIERLDFAPGSIDVVVSNYALHHLRDGDKAETVRRVYGWLKPGGRFVIGDMMFGRGGDARDREIIASKVSLLLRKGPGGWWRIAKNGGRFLFRTQERPVSMAAWEKMFSDAGYCDVRAVPVVNEAAVVLGTKPAG
ncbi:MAG: class I SAM-dependent methyltransferase [Acidimicrobiales bacterium]